MFVFSILVHVLNRISKSAPENCVQATLISKATERKSRGFGSIALFSKIIKPLFAHRIRFAAHSKPVYIWPKLHGSQSVNVRSYSSVTNEDNNVKDREQFNLVSSSIQRVKVCFNLSWYRLNNWFESSVTNVQYFFSRRKASRRSNIQECWWSFDWIFQGLNLHFIADKLSGSHEFCNFQIKGSLIRRQSFRRSSHC